ncbi:FAD-dependent oxidoreductase [Amylibacter sp.]|nr:FAD-dependent oxidoreductase [Amylibacter sp.]MDC1532081.1 FAD-dependent oxidoreductase [Amylibacter sp.]
MKFIILGAGPAGLAFANRLIENNCSDFLVLEGSHEAGGLCRSRVVDGSPMDIGGGHFLDVRRPKVLDFLFGFMPENEWNLYTRNSQIEIHDKAIQHPIEANLWQLDEDNQIDYLKSIAFAGCNLGEKTPNHFTDWIHWKLGSMIAKNYMLPYNKKMFGKNFANLGTYWLDKLPNVSFEETLRSCLNKTAYGAQPGHAQFYYPKKYGYGELWLRLAKKIEHKIEYNVSVSGIDFDNRTVITKCGKKLSAEKIITTVPWTSLEKSTNMYDGAKSDIEKLKNNSIQTDYYPNTMETEAHWIYYPSAKLAHHRVLVRHNFLDDSAGYWTETTSERVDLISENSNFSYLNKFAYPLNTIGKPEIMKKLLSWSSARGVHGLGRWGEHEHYNSDVTVEKAINLADELV